MCSCFPLKHKYCIFGLHLHFATDPNAARFPRRSRNRTYSHNFSIAANSGRPARPRCLLVTDCSSLLPAPPWRTHSQRLAWPSVYLCLSLSLPIKSFSSCSQALPGQPSFYGRKRRLRLPDNARNRIGALYIVYCSHTVNVLDSSGLLETVCCKAD